MVGHGVARLVERGFAVAGAPLDLAVLPRWVERFLHFYAEDLSTLTRPFPGVPEALDALLAAGWRLGVCTNKPTRLSVGLLDALGLGPRFGAVVGGDAAPERKPHPAPLLMTLDRLGVPPAAAVFVGDSETDVLTARAAGLPVALVRHGYTAMAVESLGRRRGGGRPLGAARAAPVAAARRGRLNRRYCVRERVGAAPLLLRVRRENPREVVHDHAAVLAFQPRHPVLLRHPVHQLVPALARQAGAADHRRAVAGDAGVEGLVPPRPLGQRFRCFLRAGGEGERQEQRGGEERRCAALTPPAPPRG